MAEATLAISRNLGDSSQRMAVPIIATRNRLVDRSSRWLEDLAETRRSLRAGSEGKWPGMARARRYRFVGAWAVVQIVAGSLFVFVAALAAFAVLSPWPPDVVSRVPPELRSRLAPAAIAAVVLAVMLGGSLVLSGQLLLMLRDVHRHVARLDAREARRRRRRDSGRPSDGRDPTSRLLPRR